MKKKGDQPTAHGFFTPSLPLSAPNPRNHSSFGQNLANPLPPPQNRRHMYMPPKERGDRKEEKGVEGDLGH